MWTVNQNVYHFSQIPGHLLKRLNHSIVLAWLKACSPKASFSIRWVSAAVLLSLKQKFNANSLLLTTRHFDNSRHSWQWCKEYSQNSETRALTKKPVARLLVKRYKKRHLAAQVCSANGLRGIFKFSEISGRPSYIYTWRKVVSSVTLEYSLILSCIVHVQCNSF